jgi:hypothetical protein
MYTIWKRDPEGLNWVHFPESAGVEITLKGQHQQQNLRAHAAHRKD